MQLKDRFGRVIPETRTREQVIDDARCRLESCQSTLASLVWERDKYQSRVTTLNQQITEKENQLQKDKEDLAQEEERGI